MTDLTSHPLLRSRFVVLLIALSLVLLATPIWRLIAPNATPGVAAAIVVTTLFMAMVVAAGYAVGRSTRMVIVTLAFAVPVAFLQVAALLSDRDGMHIAKHLVSALFLGYITVQGLRYLFTVRTVTLDTIAASLCVYFVMALLWSSVFSLTEVLQPGSFAIAHIEDAQEGRFDAPDSNLSLYYSLVTLSTLGYGDITPTRASARLFAATEAVTGQLYLAVLVARLVGLQIAGAVSNGKGA